MLHTLGTSAKRRIKTDLKQPPMMYPAAMINSDFDLKYLPTLLRYYEEEVSGATYFRALGAGHDCVSIKQKFDLLAEVEHHAASAVEPLLKKYALTPKADQVLADHGIASSKAHDSFSWSEFVAYMLRRYPLYMDEFHALEAMAPTPDLPFLFALTAHETAAIEFAEREANGDQNSIDSLTAYLATKRPVAADKEISNG